MRQAELRVLIGDDSATIGKNIARIFAESEEIEVVGEAADARQGLEFARTLHPETNYPYSAYRKRAAEAGSDFFFDKSTEFHKVLMALRNGIRTGTSE